PRLTRGISLVSCSGQWPVVSGQTGCWPVVTTIHLYGSIRASLVESASDTVVVPRSPRFRFVVLLLRMCCLNALPRRNFPRFVRLKRFAAPRCVFSLIFFALVAIVSSKHSPLSSQRSQS